MSEHVRQTGGQSTHKENDCGATTDRLGFNPVAATNLLDGAFGLGESCAGSFSVEFDGSDLLGLSEKIENFFIGSGYVRLSVLFGC